MKKLWQILRKSLRSDHGDFTRGPIAESVILLAIPMILELSLEGVFAIVDMFFVSKLGQNAVAVVGLTESVITLVYSVAIGISTGATAIVARRIGEKDPEAAAHAGAQAILVSMALSLVISLMGAVYAREILLFMGAATDVAFEGAGFTRISFLGTTAIILLFLINGIFRGAGDAAMAMRSLWIASGVNILLCPIFIHLFGLSGAALATGLGRLAGVAYQCRAFARGSGTLKFKRSHFRWDFPLMRSLLQIAWPASLQFVIGSGSWILLTRLIAEVGGTAASAGTQIAFRNFAFFILPAWGLSNAAATLVGQNLGAKEFARAEESAITTAKISAVMMALVTLFFVLGAGFLVGIFTDDPEVAHYGEQALRWLGSGFIAYGVGMVMSQALNGAGDTRTPTWINFLCFWVFQTPLAYFLARQTSWGAQGVMMAIPLAHVLLAIAMTASFRRGRWKSVEI